MKTKSLNTEEFIDAHANVIWRTANKLKHVSHNNLYTYKNQEGIKTVTFSKHFINSGQKISTKEELKDVLRVNHELSSQNHDFNGNHLNINYFEFKFNYLIEMLSQKENFKNYFIENVQYFDLDYDASLMLEIMPFLAKKEIDYIFKNPINFWKTTSTYSEVSPLTDHAIGESTLEVLSYLSKREQKDGKELMVGFIKQIEDNLVESNKNIIKRFILNEYGDFEDFKNLNIFQEHIKVNENQLSPFMDKKEERLFSVEIDLDILEKRFFVHNQNFLGYSRILENLILTLPENEDCQVVDAISKINRRNQKKELIISVKENSFLNEKKLEEMILELCSEVMKSEVLQNDPRALESWLEKYVLDKHILSKDKSSKKKHKI